MARELWYGQIMLDMRANGSLIKHQEKVSFSIQTVMFTKENGSAIKLMVLEFTQILKVLCMKAFGKTISSMAKELKLGLFFLMSK
jgi:hypothetical protein